MVRRLLAIEDDTLHHMIIGKLAKSEGYETSVATSVEKANSFLRDGRFDCITLDLNLGERTGLDVLQILAELGTQVPVIIFSGTDDNDCLEIVRIGKEFGLNIYPPLAKPGGVVQLRRVLASIPHDPTSQDPTAQGSMPEIPAAQLST
jgi:DNA-binding NtrC family response regulator